VENPNHKSWSYTDAAVANAKALVKQLMQTYGIDRDHVIRHYDVTGKLCPGITGWNADSGDESKWNGFLTSLTSQTQPQTQTKEEIDMTKAEVEALIDQRVEEKLTSLTDITGTGDHPSDWAKDAANWAKENGLIQGDGAGNYGWQKVMTREQAAKLLQSALAEEKDR
jgi:N-acetylmuramoyl-L-alanine amidase CwlA